MRQAGVLAAAGLISLNEMTGRLGEDHANAHRLALGLAKIQGIDLETENIRTNIVYFALEPACPLSAADLVERLQRDFGVWLGAEGPRSLRACTHYWVGQKEVDRLLQGIKNLLQAG